MYGSPLGLLPGPNKSLMNSNPEAASLWKGRILMHVEVADSKAPESAVAELGPDIKDMCDEDQVL